jgi:hypothetical protein
MRSSMPTSLGRKHYQELVVSMRIPRNKSSVMSAEPHTAVKNISPDEGIALAFHMKGLLSA